MSIQLIVLLGDLKLTIGVKSGFWRRGRRPGPGIASPAVTLRRSLRPQKLPAEISNHLLSLSC